jgi:hypothetical protein
MEVIAITSPALVLLAAAVAAASGHVARDQSALEIALMAYLGLLPAAIFCVMWYFAERRRAGAFYLLDRHREALRQRIEATDRRSGSGSR